MEMHKEQYEELLRRFANEIWEVGVTDDITKIIKSKMDRAPNSVGCSAEETTRKFTYMHKGYMIQAEQKVSLTVKKCK